MWNLLADNHSVLYFEQQVQITWNKRNKTNKQRLNKKYEIPNTISVEAQNTSCKLPKEASKTILKEAVN